MRRQTILRSCLVIVFIVFIAININGINSFLSVEADNALDFGHSETIVPQTWNTTKELNMNNVSKTTEAISNGYVVIDHWDDWPEDHITSLSEAKFKEMENGNYKVLKNENSTSNGVSISKQYFSNPSRDNETVWNHIGVNYVFPKEDTNYTIQVHYFTDQDYNNTTFMKEIDGHVEDDISNIHNHDYNGFVSGVWSIYDFITGHFPH